MPNTRPVRKSAKHAEDSVEANSSIISDDFEEEDHLQEVAVAAAQAAAAAAASAAHPRGDLADGVGSPEIHQKRPVRKPRATSGGKPSAQDVQAVGVKAALYLAANLTHSSSYPGLKKKAGESSKGMQDRAWLNLSTDPLYRKLIDTPWSESDVVRRVKLANAHELLIYLGPKPDGSINPQRWPEHRELIDTFQKLLMRDAIPPIDAKPFAFPKLYVDTVVQNYIATCHAIDRTDGNPEESRLTLLGSLFEQAQQAQIPHIDIPCLFFILDAMKREVQELIQENKDNVAEGNEHLVLEKKYPYAAYHKNALDFIRATVARMEKADIALAAQDKKAQKGRPTSTGGRKGRAAAARAASEEEDDEPLVHRVPAVARLGNEADGLHDEESDADTQIFDPSMLQIVPDPLHRVYPGVDAEFPRQHLQPNLTQSTLNTPLGSRHPTTHTQPLRSPGLGSEDEYRDHSVAQDERREDSTFGIPQYSQHDEEIPVNPRARPRKIPFGQDSQVESGPRKRRRWSQEDEDELERGLQIHTFAAKRWRMILNDGLAKGRFEDRTNVDLKDKARQMREARKKAGLPLGGWRFGSERGDQTPVKMQRGNDEMGSEHDLSQHHTPAPGFDATQASFDGTPVPGFDASQAAHGFDDSQAAGGFVDSQASGSGLDPSQHVHQQHQQQQQQQQHAEGLVHQTQQQMAGLVDPQQELHDHHHHYHHAHHQQHHDHVQQELDPSQQHVMDHSQQSMVDPSQTMDHHTQPHTQEMVDPSQASQESMLDQPMAG
ncbi:hypothetical protein HKX48_002866 [Thoreauomyces humboldtii]|nr:hypothetical protein HKX48_002866 [Thoreauomyces humboldtii]